MNPIVDGGGEAPAAGRLTSVARVYQGLVLLLEAWCVIQLGAMAAVVLLGVWYRYAVQRALPWYDEFAEFLLVWLTFYGAVLAAHRRAHIGFETLLDYVPALVRRVLLVAAEVVVLAVQIALMVYGWNLVRAASFDTAISIRAVRLSWVYSAIPIGAGLIFLIMLPRTLQRIIGETRA